jgi:Na+/alanine symporter
MQDTDLIKQCLELTSKAMSMAEKSTEEAHETTRSVLLTYGTVVVTIVLCVFLFSLFSTYMTYSYDYELKNVSYNENRNFYKGD